MHDMSRTKHPTKQTMYCSLHTELSNKQSQPIPNNEHVFSERRTLQIPNTEHYEHRTSVLRTPNSVQGQSWHWTQGDPVPERPVKVLAYMGPWGPWAHGPMGLMGPMGPWAPHIFICRWMILAGAKILAKMCMRLICIILMSFWWFVFLYEIK